MLIARGYMIRLLYYPPLSGNEPADAMRAAPHEDINFITLLPAASQQGLEIKPKQSDWQQVETSSDSIVVNIGDMLKELTDHELPSTTHRVVNPAKEARQMARISAPLFCHPDHRGFHLNTQQVTTCKTGSTRSTHRR